MGTMNYSQELSKLLDISFNDLIIPVKNFDPDLNNYDEALTFDHELMNYGFMMRIKSLEILKGIPIDEITDVYNTFVNYVVKYYIGSKKEPFHRGFPNSILTKSKIELYRDAISHYESNGTWSPEESTMLYRDLNITELSLKEIKIMTEDDYKDYFKESYIKSSVPLSESDLSRVKLFIEIYNNSNEYKNYYPSQATVRSIMVSNGLVKPKNIDDVLRVALFKSNLPVTELKANKKLGFNGRWTVDSKFIHFNRKDRVFILSLIDGFKDLEKILEDAIINYGRWIALGNILHPGEYYKRFPTAFQFFERLRNQSVMGKIRSFDSKINEFDSKKDLDGMLDLLSTRPGTMARKLDYLLRTYNNTESFNKIMSKFSSVGKNISSKVLVELYNHFKSPNQISSVKVNGRDMVFERGEYRLDQMISSQAAGYISTIIEVKLSELPKLSYRIDNISEDLKLIPVNVTNTGNNDNVESSKRYSRYKLSDDYKVLRAFLHWYDDNGTIDLDLSVPALDENMNVITTISYSNLKQSGIYHSGDVRHKKGGCAEYVDIHLDKLDNNIKYILLVAYSFDGQPFNSVKECLFGYMPLYDNQAHIFNLKSAKGLVGITSNSTANVMCIFDVKEKEFIWLDINILDRTSSSIISNTMTLVKQVFNKKNDILSVYDLLRINKIRNNDSDESELRSFDVKDINNKLINELLP